MSAGGVAVVTIAHGRHEHLELQQRSLTRSGQVPDVYVVAAMDDPDLLGWRPPGAPAPRPVAVPGDPLGLPLAAARNAAVDAALAAGAEVVVLLDVDCVAAPGLVAAYAEAVRSEPDTVWSGPVTYLPPPPVGGYDLARLADLDAPHPARPDPGPGGRVRGADPDLFWSLSFAVHRDAWHRVGGFCEEYVGYGAEDTDFGRLVRTAGLDLGWVGDARAYHQHHPTQHPPVQHLDDILRNGALFHRRWGSWPMRGWLEEMAEMGLVVADGRGWVRPEPAPGAPGQVDPDARTKEKT
ncbi:glycosyltransferase family 2 protein [Nocardioides pacificus]